MGIALRELQHCNKCNNRNNRKAAENEKIGHLTVLTGPLGMPR